MRTGGGFSSPPMVVRWLKHGTNGKVVLGLCLGKVVVTRRKERILEMFDSL